MNIEEIVKNMREPKVKDIRAVSHIQDETEQEIKMLSNLTGLSEAEIDELSIAQWRLLDEKLKSFMFPAGASA